MALGGADNLARSPELRTKLLWTLGLLCAYRIGVHIPVPGVDGGALAHFFESVAGTLFGLFDMFSGGGLRNVSVFALCIMPYISASIILQLLQVVDEQGIVESVRVVVVQLFALFKWHIVVGAVVVVVVKHGHLITKCVFQTVCKSGFS